MCKGWGGFPKRKRGGNSRETEKVAVAFNTEFVGEGRRRGFRPESFRKRQAERGLGGGNFSPGPRNLRWRQRNLYLGRREPGGVTSTLSARWGGSNEKHLENGDGQWAPRRSHEGFAVRVCCRRYRPEKKVQIEKAEGALKLSGKRSPEVGQEAREQEAKGAERRCREGRGLREA